MAITYDIAAYQPPDVAGQPYVAGFSTATSLGRLVTGLEKLAQRFLLELMTESGSIPFATGRGSSFVPSISRGVLSEIDVQIAFGVAMLQVTSNLQVEETDDDPDDERFANAQVSDMQLLEGGVKLNITLSNRSGQSGSVSIPLNINTTNPLITAPLD